MNIGIIGTGNVGSGLGDIWAKQGHQILFSFSKDMNQAREVAEAAGANARVGTPKEAVAFGEIVVLAVPWGAVDTALEQAGSLQGKILLTTVNALKPDFSGLEIGTTASAGEEIAKRAPGAIVVESLPVNAEILHSSSRQFGAVSPTVFYVGDDANAKSIVAKLLEEAGMEPIDAGPLTNARLIEPTGFLVAQLGYALGLGPNVALKLLRR